MRKILKHKYIHSLCIHFSMFTSLMAVIYITIKFRNCY